MLVGLILIYPCVFDNNLSFLKLKVAFLIELCIMCLTLKYLGAIFMAIRAAPQFVGYHLERSRLD